MSISPTPHDWGMVSDVESLWDAATMVPPQRAWTVEEYLRLTDSTNRFVEYTDGRIEVLEMPTIAHQRILTYLFVAMHNFVVQHGLGEVLFAGLRVQVDDAKFREPDIVFLRRGHEANVQNRYWNAADLVLEVVSDDPESRKRDVVTKRADYAAAGIPEYWIVDPAEERVTVLTFENGAYVTLGEYAPGDVAASEVLGGFAVDAAAIFKAAQG
jgi:Uma2 family endonuclease